jgi:Sugar transferases involved in lipopolysaccharide synthesis
MKRVFDIIFSLTVLLLFLPLGFVISVLILISSKGGIFYKQTKIWQK